MKALQSSSHNHGRAPRLLRRAAGSFGPTAGRPARECWIYGRHTVAAALANPQRRWHRLAALAGHEQEARALVDGARARQLGDGDGIRVLDRHQFEEILPD